MKLIVAADDNQRAQGYLFWDDGESIGECSIKKMFYVCGTNLLFHFYYNYYTMEIVFTMII